MSKHLRTTKQGMEKTVSREQGDNNATDNRKTYNQNLDSKTQRWINEDAQYFLHQALSTPVMNVLSKTEGAYIEDIGK